VAQGPAVVSFLDIVQAKYILVLNHHILEPKFGNMYYKKCHIRIVNIQS
jgi:hypothetical protein